MGRRRQLHSVQEIAVDTGLTENAVRDAYHSGRLRWIGHFAPATHGGKPARLFTSDSVRAFKRYLMTRTKGQAPRVTSREVIEARLERVNQAERELLERQAERDAHWQALRPFQQRMRGGL